MKRVVLCDVDGVLVDGQTQEHLLFFLFWRYKISFCIFLQVYFWFFLYKLHFVEDVMNIRRHAFRAFRGWTIQQMNELFSDFFKLAVRPRLRVSVIDFLKEKHAEGYEIILVSASLLGIVESIRDHLGFGQIIATRLEFKTDICTGMMVGVVPYGSHKLEEAENFIDMNGFEWEGSFALGDHISDRMLLERVSCPIVVHPEPRLRVLAQEKGWKIL